MEKPLRLIVIDFYGRIFPHFLFGRSSEIQNNVKKLCLQPKIDFAGFQSSFAGHKKFFQRIYKILLGN